VASQIDSYIPIQGVLPPIGWQQTTIPRIRGSSVCTIIHLSYAPLQRYLRQTMQLSTAYCMAWTTVTAICWQELAE